MRRTHAGLHCAERMLDGLAALAHGQRVRIKAMLHSIEQMLRAPTEESVAPALSCTEI